MAHNVEPMDVDCIDSDFDNKENTFHHSNLLPCTEKGYEELDVSELNMKLRYSITPAASPMSKSYTAYTDNRCLDSDDSLNCTDENNLTRSLNSTITKNDSVIKSLKTLPLQSLPTEFGDRNSVLKPLDTTVTDTNITITLSEANEVDENISLPSTSSSLTHTPEATTPVNDIKNANGSPIMRGLKTVLNMFRPSQSPIPTTEGENTKPELSSLDSTTTEEKLPVLASTPIAAHRSKDPSRRSSPLKDSITFKDDLEKELEWKDETTIFFSQDKIPIHKLFFQNTKSVTENVPDADIVKPDVNNPNSTVEYMDISFNDTIANDRTLSENQVDLATDKNEFLVTNESDGEFVDCETTFTNESQVQNAPEIDLTHSFTEKPLNTLKSVDNSSIEPSKDNTNPIQEVREDTNSTISIIQELDSLLEGDSKKDISSNENPIAFTALDKITEKEVQKEVIPDPAGPPNANSGIENIQSEETTNLESNLTMESVTTKSVLSIEEQVVPESQEPEEIPFIHEAKPTDVPLPDEDDIEKELKLTDVLETVDTLQTNTQDVKMTKSDKTRIISETVDIIDSPPAQESIHLPDESALINTQDVKMTKSDKTQIISETVDIIDSPPAQESIHLPDESALITNMTTNNDVLYAVDQTVPEEVNKEIVKSETKTPEIESVDIKERVADLSVLSDLVNQPILNDNEQLELKAVQIRNCEDTQQIDNEIKVIPLSSESVQELHLESLPIKQLYLNPTVSNIEQNDPALTDCDVNSTIMIENKINEIQKDTTASNPDSNNEVGVTLENASLTRDNVNVHMITDFNNDVPQYNLTIANEESMLAQNLTENNVDSSVLFDNKSDVRADITVEFKIDTTLENSGETTAVTNTKKDAEFNEIVNNIVVKSKLDDTQECFKDNLPSTDINTTLESNKDTSSVIKIKKDAEFNEIANNIVVESKLDDTQECFKGNLPSTDINTTLESNKDTSTVIIIKTDAEFNEIANDFVVESKLDDTQGCFKGNLPSTDINTTLESNKDTSTVINTKKDAEFNDLANNIVVESKLDVTQEYLKHNMPPTDVNTTLEMNTTAVIDIRKDVESNEMANTADVVQSKIDISQDHFVDNMPPIDTCNEPVNKPETSDTCESLNTDMEIIVSENNSPYVSVTAGIDTESKTPDDNLGIIENTLTSTVPSSPPIVSKGYNFNFDEIENPFATKTKIRLSPPPNTPSKNEELKNAPYTGFEMPKKAPINRRKSQPPERKKTAMNKKKFNTTIDVKIPNDEPKSGKETLEPTMNLKPALQNKNLTDINLKPNEITEIEFKSSDSKDSETRENETCQANDQSLKLEDGKENKIEKSSCESSVTNISDVKTSSSEQSTFFSATTSSSESFKSKNVFNLPEIDDVNFNPFATKSKMRQSPPPLDLEQNPFDIKTKTKISPDSSMISINNEKENMVNKVDVEDKMDIEQMEKEVDISNVTSKTVDRRNLTHEINTEDEDTEEGPFLEAEDALDKASSLGDREFNRLPTQNEDNLEAGEMFIDAETFEFLLNQNKTNMVADSGKESLFLKFDPLFAKKISSDGVVAALSKVQKRHSTPTKARPSLRNDASPIAGPSNIDITYETNLNPSAEESNEDINITVSKPTMIVTPAVNPAMTPRNKSITPNRSNRRSITFTSPALAVIDRLLSMSANNSLVDTTVTQSQNEADLALTQLRELLAEKEIDVYNLKAESMELKERLNTMESQVKVLEADGNERLKKINELNGQLAEKSKINKSMAAVVEEYERTIASLIAETEQDKKRHAEERMRLINERDEQTAHLASMEASFSDLHSKYEKSKQVIITFKANEKAYEKSIKDCEESMTKMQNNYEMLKQHATSKLNHANSELEKINKAHEAEVLKLNALLKRNALHITSLEETLAQKTKANDELTAICDELINKVG